MQNIFTLASPTTLFALGAATLVIPLFAIVGTSFVRLVIVLNLLRQAIGAQSVPPSYVLNVIAAALTISIMVSPVSETIDVIETLHFSEISYAQSFDVAGTVAAPLLRFMSDNTGQAEKDFMERIRDERWSPSAQTRFSKNSIFIVLPAFVLSEVRRGFEIGFLLYIPFVIVDVTIATIITSLGMSSVSPNIIALPLKLLLFVYIDGWTRLARNLISGYF